MPITSKYVFVASMDIDAEHEDLFNEVYDTEHVPMLMKVPGVLAVSRLKGEPFTVSMGGELKEMPTISPRYSAVYEIESPDVLTSPEWSAAIEEGRWPSQVRPFTSNRKHAVYKIC